MFKIEEVEQEIAESQPTLRITKLISKKTTCPVERALKASYSAKKRTPISLMLTALVHACVLQKRIYCVITRDCCDELAKSNRNAKFALGKSTEEIPNSDYKKVLFLADKANCFELVQAGSGRKAAIYKLSHPAVLAHLISLGVDEVAQKEECLDFVNRKTFKNKDIGKFCSAVLEDLAQTICKKQEGICEKTDFNKLWRPINEID